MKQPNPFLEWPDMDRLSDRQLLKLCLFEIIELKAELRAASSLLLQAHKSVCSSEQFGSFVDKAQDAAIAEMIEHAKIVSQQGQRPDTN